MYKKIILGISIVGILTSLVSAQTVNEEPAIGLTQEQAVLKEEILEMDPNALVFTTQEEADKYFDELETNTTIEIEAIDHSNLARAGNENVEWIIKVNHNLVSTVNLRYYWTMSEGKRAWISQYQAPNVTMSGYAPGTDFTLVSSNFTRNSREILTGNYLVQYKYYLLIEQIPLNYRTCSYYITHDVALSPSVTTSWN